jgi:hypothetical protein
MPKNVELPDGRVVEFPDNMSDDAVSAAIKQSLAPPTPKTSPEKLFGVNPVSDTLGSIGSHLKNMVAGPYHAFTDAPRNPEEAQIKGADASSGTVANALGQFGLGAARMLVQPTREAGRNAIAAAKVGNYVGKPDSAVAQGIRAVPFVGPAAGGLVDEAEAKGMLPALAGLGTDLAAPLAAGKAASAIRGAAPSMGEGALSISKADRGYDKTIGRAFLDETKGIRPATIQKSAADKIAQLTPQVEDMAARHTGPVSIAPARAVVSDTQLAAAKKNNVGGYNAVEPVREQLTVNHFGNNQPFAPPTVGSPSAGIAEMQTATDALGLKRGLRDQFVKNWSPDAASTAAKDAAKGASREIDHSLDSALGPDFASTNQIISSLIPVEDAAEGLTRAADLPQRMGDKLRAHTGALTSAVFGAGAGAAHAGVLGGLAGGAMGFAIPEMVGSPTFRAGLARTMNSKIPQYVSPYISAGDLQYPRKDQQ